MAPWKSWFSHRGTYLGKDSCFTQRHLESKFGWPGNTLRPATWQEPQSEPKLTDKSLVSIHPLPSNLRPSHNAWQHLWSPSCKSFLPSSRHELAHFCSINITFVFVDTSRRKFFSQDDTGVSLILCNLLKITSNKFSFVETNMWFAVLSERRSDQEPERFIYNVQITDLGVLLISTGASACSNIMITNMARSQILMATSKNDFELAVHINLTRK